jgi:hypothetical protein
MSISIKDPKESITVTFNFSKIPNEISNPVIEILEFGTSLSVPGMIVGSPQVSEQKVTQLITGGESGKKYNVRCTVDVVTTGERFVAKGILPVKS